MGFEADTGAHFDAGPDAALGLEDGSPRAVVHDGIVYLYHCDVCCTSYASGLEI